MAQTDYALAVERVLGVVEYGSASTYEALVNSWRDVRPIPSQPVLDAAWVQIELERAAKLALRIYAQPFINNAALWVRIHKALDDARFPFVVATATGATILANLRLQVTTVVDVISTAPIGVVNEFHKERVLLGSTTATLNAAGIAAMTAAECRILIDVARRAANQGLSIVTAVSTLND